MGSPPSTQTVTQKTEIDPIQKSYLFGTPLPLDFELAMEARNRELLGLTPLEPQTTLVPSTGPQLSPEDRPAPVDYENYFPMASGEVPVSGIFGLANGGTVLSQLPNLSDRDVAYRTAMQARQGYALGGLIKGPGTGTSDEIPAVIYQNGVPVDQALLSNGEVVLSRKDLQNMSPDGNADTAARVVGDSPNGSRGEAAARMYAMTEMFRNGGRIK